jgi:penicillin-binding protein 1C
MRARLLNAGRIAAWIAPMLCILLGCCWYLLPEPPPLPAVSYSQRVVARDGSLLRLTLSADDKYRVHTPLNEVSSELIDATLTHEDRHYFQHPGVNPVATVRAGLGFLTGKRDGGASTLTMQLVRVRYGLRTRSIRGKLVQMLRALEIERHHSKREILESYLNLAPYGRNIEGVGAASLIYFGKTPAKLSKYEAFALSVIPQSPRRRAPASEASNAALAAAHRRVSREMQVPSSDPSESFDPQARARLQFAAPHFVQQILADLPACREIVTTLDPKLQVLLERQIAGYLATQRQTGISNAAALLVDTRSMEVLAQCGSADFFDEALAGQVDGTRSRRSPGSTLKPFIYALAMEQGFIHPLSILKDAPHSFAGYNPENFDGEFSGPITATEALARSRNLPAVGLAAQLKRPALYDWLIAAGVRLPREADFYGLALPLGGGEVTMEELVRLYAMLANGGRLRPLCRTRPNPDEPGTRVLGPEAAFLALEMLGQVPRPGLAQPAGEDGIHWKTGTSHGFRDAWSVAVFGHFVLAVWLGNFDGTPNPALVGRTCAGPLLFQIIDGMRGRGPAPAEILQPPFGANLREEEFCAVSGQLPGSLCPHRVRGWFIPGVSPIGTCEIHREILVDAKTGLRVSTDDGSRELRREVYEFWPSDLLALFAKAGIPRRLPPPCLPGNESPVESIARSGQPPQIVSPTPSQAYFLTAGGHIELRALTDADVARLYWFADKDFIGATASGQTIPWSAPPGTYRLTALDDHGRAGVSRVSIESSPAR